MEWPPPSLWDEATGRGVRTFQYDSLTLKYEVALIVPAGHAKPTARDARLPLVVYFAGMSSLGGLRGLDLSRFAEISGEPFVMAGPLRKKGTWWFLDSEKDPTGFIEGNFLAAHVDLVMAWIRELANEPSINEEWISLCGFSAGAYAVTEVVARNRALTFNAVLVGGLHGHSQPDYQGLEPSLCNEATKTKWEAYIRRIRHHYPPREFLCVHHPDDELSPWRYAQAILLAMDSRRQQLRHSPLQVELLQGMPKSRKNKSCHHYHDKVLLKRSFFGQLMPNGGILPQTSGVWEEEGLYQRFPLRPTIDEIRPQEETQESDFLRNQQALHTSYAAPRISTLEWLRPPSDFAPQHTTSVPLTPPPPPPCQRVPSTFLATHAQNQLTQIPQACGSTEGAALERCSVRNNLRNDARRFLACASPNCWFLVHPNPIFGGYCCRKCHWRQTSGSKSKKKHGDLCEQREAPADATKADPEPPTATFGESTY